jgi:hypothetical protein
MISVERPKTKENFRSREKNRKWKTGIRVVNLYVLRAKDEKALSICSGNTCCAFVLRTKNMHISVI